VTHSQVAGAEGEFVDPQVRDELGQQSARPVEPGEIGDERLMQSVTQVRRMGRDRAFVRCFPRR
jgi:hypothetical protein